MYQKKPQRPQLRPATSIKMIKKIGKKGKRWLRDRKKLIRNAIKEGRLKLVNSKLHGFCKDCGRFKYLTPDHRIRRSQGGSNEKENIDWVCVSCHWKRDNMGDPKKRKPKSKKPDWQKEHKCKNCKKKVAVLLCSHCGKISV